MIGENKNTINEKEILDICIAAFISFIAYIFIWKSPYNVTGDMNYNIISYGCVIVGGILLFVILSNLKWKLKNDKIFLAINGVVFASIIIGLLLVYEFEIKLKFSDSLSHNFLREKYNHLKFCCIMIPSIVGVIYVLKKYLKKQRRLFRVVISICLSLIVGVLLYSPNVFRDANAGLYHTHAYINSIINVVYHFPYDDINSSIYGHYGIIYLPLVKLFGNDLNAIIMSISIMGIIMMACFLYSLSHVIESDGLFFASGLAITGTLTTYFNSGQYYQIMPHRLVFVAIASAYITWSLKHKIKSAYRWIIAVIIGTLAFVFNIETAAIVVLMIGSAEIIYTFKISIKDILISVLKIVVYCVSCFFLSYIIVNIYNCIYGGDINSIKTYIYPIGSEVYNMSDILRMDIPIPLSGYMLHIIVFFIAALPILKNILFNKSVSTIDIIILENSVAGWGLLTYYMNRTAVGNLSISHIQLIFAIAYFANYFILNGVGIKEILVKVKSMYSLAALFLLVWFAIEGAIQFSGSLQAREGVWNMETYRSDRYKLAEWMRSKEEPLIIGQGIPELCYDIKIDECIGITDWSDMNMYSMKKVLTYLDQGKNVIVSNPTWQHDGWTVVEELTRYGYEAVDDIYTDTLSCTYYERVDN